MQLHRCRRALKRIAIPAGGKVKGVTYIWEGRFCGPRVAVGASFSRPTGVDILTISRRLGHANPKITPSIYGHLYGNTDDKAAQAVEAMFARIGGTE